MKTVTLKFVSVLLLLGGAIPLLAQSTFSGGTGAEDNPYRINTTDDLIQLSTDVNGGQPYSGCFFLQTADLVFDKSIENNFTPIGDGTYSFEGNYDGDSHTISGLNINRDDGYNGIFGSLNCYASPTIYKVCNLVLSNSTIAGKMNTGGIAGELAIGYVDNCHVTDDVTITANGYYVGGVVGRMSNASCYVRGCTNASTVSGGAQQSIGGIVGYRVGGRISDCISFGTVTGVGSYHGAVVGNPMRNASNIQDQTIVKNCYFYSSMSFPKVGSVGDANNGKKAWKVLAADGVTLNFGTPVTDYGRVKAYSTGLMVDGVFYAGGYGETRSASVTNYLYDAVTITPSVDALTPGFAAIYNATYNDGKSSRPLTDNGNGSYTFYMPIVNGTGYDVTIGYNPIFELLDDDSEAALKNADRIASQNTNGVEKVVLRGRTLYKDGSWNTICLPFSLSAEQLAASPLAGAVIKSLVNATVSGATVTLVFTENDLPDSGETMIMAGKPYLVKWTSGANVVDPVFTDVTIDTGAENRVIAPDDANGLVKMIGYYDSFNITSANRNIYYMTASNTLRTTAKDRTLKAFRAYFELNPEPGAAAKDLTINMDFGGSTGVISETVNENSEEQATMYNLQGQRIGNGYKGIVVVNGKKIIK